MAEATPGGASAVDEPDEDAPRGGPHASLGKFDRDTAVWRDGDAYAAEVSPDWRAGRGPHGGYLAAMLLRALMASVADAARAPRSLTIHYARAPEPGPVQIVTTLEREGRSLSTLSARMLQDGKLIALVLAAFSVAWTGPEISEVTMPDVAPADPSREGLKLMEHGPEFARHIVLQPRFEGRPLSGEERPMVIRAWMGLVEPRPIDALALAFFSDALIPAPYMRMTEWNAVPTIDLTVHFRERMRPAPDADPHELCLAQTTSELVHDGFFIEDGLIWAADGTLLAHSRQLAIVVPFRG
ncbi:MAG TPA: thioesterase family protein [Solirubrobacteraceae bacterium]|nr:thioesterase family protein [Solirubrobacteraceae bacterium]